MPNFKQHEDKAIIKEALRGRRYNATPAIGAYEKDPFAAIDYVGL